MHGGNLVVQDFQVRAQDQARLAIQRNAPQALVHVGIAGTGGNVGEGIGHAARFAAGQGQHLHVAVGIGRVVAGVDLVVHIVRARQQQAGVAHAGTGAMQVDIAALQLVGTAAGTQGLVVVRVAFNVHILRVGQVVSGAHIGNAQVLQHRAFAHANVHVQVLRDLLQIAAAAVRVQQQAAGAGGHVQHHQGRIHGGMGCVVDMQAHWGGIGPVGGDLDAQPLAAQGAVRPGKGGGLALGGGQVGKQGGAFCGVQGAQVLHLHAGRAVLHGDLPVLGAGHGGGLGAKPGL